MWHFYRCNILSNVGLLRHCIDIQQQCGISLAVAFFEMQDCDGTESVSYSKCGITVAVKSCIMQDCYGIEWVSCNKCGISIIVTFCGMQDCYGIEWVPYGKCGISITVKSCGMQDCYGIEWVSYSKCGISIVVNFAEYRIVTALIWYPIAMWYFYRCEILQNVRLLRHRLIFYNDVAFV